MKRPTIHDVARAAGVSHMTVSRVVRGYHVVSRDTQSKVHQAILKTGYKPDPALSALAAYRSSKISENKNDGSTLAFLDCDRTGFSQNVLSGLRAEAALLGYTVESFDMQKDSRSQCQLNRTLYHRGVRGLLFGPSDEEWDFESWNWDAYASVSLGALTHHPAMHAVTMNYFEGSHSACRMLREMGCKHIGFVVDPSLERRTGHRWLGGYLAAMEDHQPTIYRGKYPLGTDFKRWLKREKIDGILTIHIEARKHWSRDESTIVLLNDTHHVNDLTHLSLNPEHIGAEGVRFLHHLLLRQEYGIPLEPKVLSLNGTWVL